MTMNEQYQFAEHLQQAYSSAKSSDNLESSERNDATKRIREPFVYALSESAREGLDDQAKARRAAKESVEKSPYSFG